MKIKFTNTKQDYDKILEVSHLNLVKNNPQKANLLPIIYLISIGTMLYLEIDIALKIFLIAYFIIASIVDFIRRSKVKKELKISFIDALGPDFLLKEKEIEIEETGFTLKTEDRTISMKWSLVESITHFEDLLLLSINTGHFYLIPEKKILEGSFSDFVKTVKKFYEEINCNNIINENNLFPKYIFTSDKKYVNERRLVFSDINGKYVNLVVKAIISLFLLSTILIILWLWESWPFLKILILSISFLLIVLIFSDCLSLKIFKKKKSKPIDEDKKITIYLTDYWIFIQSNDFLQKIYWNKCMAFHYHKKGYLVRLPRRIIYLPHVSLQESTIEDVKKILSSKITNKK